VPAPFPASAVPPQPQELARHWLALALAAAQPWLALVLAEVRLWLAPASAAVQALVPGVELPWPEPAA
jgi:hypothetical protein